MRLTDIAETVMAKRYLRRKEDGTQETAAEMIRRVADVIAAEDAKYGVDKKGVKASAAAFYNLMDQQDFMPNSPTLTGAGTQLGQLSACFVLPVGDSLPEIYQTMKEAALIHQTGGGCVAGDAHVYTTFCGVEQIETLYNRVRGLGVTETVLPDHKIMDVTDLGIRTFALDPESGRFEAKQVTHLWQWDVPADQQYSVCCTDGTEVTASAWHPFMVLTDKGIAPRRSDELRTGDILLTPNRSIRDIWPFEEYREQDGLVLNEGLAWLTGCFIGCGSLESDETGAAGKGGPLLRFLAACPDVLLFARSVLIDQGIDVAIQTEGPGLWSLAAADNSFVPRFAGITGWAPGADAGVTLPEWVAKSPLSVIGAFLGGLIDSAGRIAAAGSPVEYITARPDLAKRLVSLLSALSLNPATRGRPPEYHILMADCKSTPELLEMVADRLHDPVKKERLLPIHYGPQQRAAAPIPQPFERLTDGWAVVKSVAVAAEAKPFYDFTVEGFNNYLAGGGLGKLAVIHNTGFAFSRLRPEGDAVRSSQGVASGPVSFLKVYNASTEAIKQGGTRRGANMGILRVDHPDIIKFVECKGDTSQITNFNISVAITDAFMAALEAGDNYDLISPRTGRAVGKLKAQAVWDRLVQAAWATGEPGLVFIDRINRRNPNNHAEVIEATNPCFHPDTLIATERGLERIADLYERAAGGWVRIATDDRVVRLGQAVNGSAGSGLGVTLRPARVFRTGTKATVKVILSNWLQLKVTPDHRLLTTGGWKEAGRLTADDLVLVQAGLMARGVRARTEFVARVAAVEPAETVPVYDIHEPATNSLIANGVVAHNCGEQPLPPHGSCNLGSINLANFVQNAHTDRAEVDWERLAAVTHRSVHFLDNVIDANKFPLAAIAEKARRDRRIGLGVMGWAEMLVQLGLAYDSDEGCDMGRRVMQFIKAEAVAASARLADERGAYPEWEGSRWHEAGIKVRNATLTTVAPTGTISLFGAQPEMPCSGGIEPKFALVFTRNQAGALMLDEDGQFAGLARSEGWYSPELMERVAAAGSARGIDGVPPRWQQAFATAHDILPYWHVRMQAAFQGSDELGVLEQPLDAACSKTINFPNDATIGDIEAAYAEAWHLGLKGMTVYRDGAREGQVLSRGDRVGESRADAAVPVGPDLAPRPAEAAGKMYVIPTHFGKMTLDVHMDEKGEPFEIIVSVGAAGSDLMADAVGMGMLVSILLRLRSDVPVRDRLEIVIDKLKNIGGSSSYGFGPDRITSLASAVSRGLQRFLGWHTAGGFGTAQAVAVTASPGPVKPEAITPGDQHVDPCPECGSFTLMKGEGCETCYNCGYSKC